jgi:hypothetical protein
LKSKTPGWDPKGSQPFLIREKGGQARETRLPLDYRKTDGKTDGKTVEKRLRETFEEKRGGVIRVG